MLSNEQRRLIDRWESLLDTVYVHRLILAEIHLHPDDRAKLLAYVDSIGYTQVVEEIAADPPHIWDVPIVLDPACSDASRLIYKDGMQPRFAAEPPFEPIDTWQDEEV